MINKRSVNMGSPIIIRPDCKTTNGQKAYTQESIIAAQISSQIESARQTTAHAKEPRAKAQAAIDEMLTMAQSMGTLSSALYKASTDLTKRADAAKVAAIQAADKVRASYERLMSMNFDKVESCVDTMERLLISLDALHKFGESGKLASLVAAISGAAQK